MKYSPASLKTVYRCTRPVSPHPLARYAPPGSATLAASAADALIAAEDEDLVVLVNDDLARRWASASDTGRYSDGSHAVVYAAGTPTVAISERSYWATVNWFGLYPDPEPQQGFVVCACSVEVEGRSYMRGWREHPMLVHPSDYGFCQALARREAPATAYFVVPSARRWKGRCVPVFRKEAIRCQTILSRFDLEWDATAAAVYRRQRGRRYLVPIDRVYEMLPPRVPTA